MIPEELYYTEEEENILDSEDPTHFSDKELAAMWRKEWLRTKYYREGDFKLEERSRQNSMAVSFFEKVIEDLQKVAKTKLNAHRTKCLRLIDKFTHIESDMKTAFLTYLQVTGLNKNAKKLYGYK